MSVVLKPQDVLISLRLIALNGEDWSYPSLAAALDISVGEIHNAIKRLTLARLYNVHRRAPVRSSLQEFLVHGVKYAFPAERGQVTYGVPTAWAASPLKEFLIGAEDIPPVWPCGEGMVRGYELKPLYPTVAKIALRDTQLYEVLALVDGIRIGSARERQLAVQLLEERLNPERAVVRLTKPLTEDLEACIPTF